jgi:hypothetical protein
MITLAQGRALSKSTLRCFGVRPKQVENSNRIDNSTTTFESRRLSPLSLFFELPKERVSYWANKGEPFGPSGSSQVFSAHVKYY